MARYLAGEMTTKEEIAYLSDVEKSQDEIAELKNMEKNWRYFDQNPSPKDWDSGKAWERLHEKLDTEGLLEEQAGVPGPGRFSPLLRMAASIALILAIGIPSVYFGLIRNNMDSPVRQHIAEEGMSTIDLPDGSRIYLNQGAEISYSKAFKNQRSVELQGEAFFEVMSDPKNPFTVHSGQMLVTVLGTSFNVKQLENSSDVEVYVKSGKVRVSVDQSDQYIQLESEEFGILENKVLSSSQQEDPNYISWKTKNFKFVNSALTEVLRELEESYHIAIHTEGLDLSELRITTSYSGQSIDAILETISAAFEMSVSHKENNYFLTK
jgi:ferric-dicitrate binding protein FerR (iron transport regulator)